MWWGCWSLSVHTLWMAGVMCLPPKQDSIAMSSGGPTGAPTLLLDGEQQGLISEKPERAPCGRVTCKGSPGRAPCWGVTQKNELLQLPLLLLLLRVFPRNQRPMGEAILLARPQEQPSLSWSKCLGARETEPRTVPDMVA